MKLAKPKLADGTQPGRKLARRESELLGRGGRGVAALIPDVGESLAMRAAERDRALDLLDRLERIVPRDGFLPPAHQDVLREVRAALVELGKRAPEERAVWVDRVGAR
jgi:hypothetical protein